MMTSESTARLTQIDHVRRAMIAGQSHAPQALNGRDWVWQSWRRCLDQGAGPQHTVDFNAISRSCIRETRAMHQSLVEVVQPIVQQLAAAIAPLRYFVLLTDATGTVIHTAGVDRRHGRHARTIARIGLDLSEPSAGTTAISGALNEQAPVWLHRGEHFFSNFSVYSCAGAPLWGPVGRCLGMLDVTGVHAVERPELMHLVSQYALYIENALLEAQPRRLLLRLHWASAWDAARADDGGLLAVDGDGVIVGSNRAARLMLPQLLHDNHQQQHLKDLFAVPWSELFDLEKTGRRRTVPLWSGLHVQVAAQGRYADARPARPAQAGSPQRTLKAIEAELVLQAVRESGGRVDVAARALGLSRATVYRRLRSIRNLPRKN